MKPRQRWLSVTAFVFLFVFAYAAPAFAAEAGEPNPAEGTLGDVFRWLNFFLVFGGLGYLIAKKGPAFFRSRVEAVAASIKEAAAARAAAEQQLRETEEKLARLNQEVAEMRAAAQRESAAEADRIRAVTRDEIEKIERAARAEIEAAERAARIELRAMAARLAVERADALIRKRLTAETQATLFRSFLDNLARSVH